MVSSRIVELPEDEVTDEVLPIPEMMFAAGEEPVGVRVLTYQSSRAINHILNSLEEDEIQTLRMSPFGKIVDIAEKPGFSGRFARYILSRQLKVEKKYEAWFRFAGKPIRFSLREFAIVTGLNCGEFPKSAKWKSKKSTSEKQYWRELFGKHDDLRVSTALKMLRRKTVTDKELRIKLACSAILSSVLLATNLKMKMIKEYAEALVDLEEFFSYPWGRLAFEMLMGSIKQRDEVSLSQNTIAVKGFALALQLVMVEAVPALTEVVLETCSSSESDSCEEDEDFVHKKTKKHTLSPGHAREVDKKSNVLVRSIIPEDPDRPIVAANLEWKDEVMNVKVDNLVKLIMQKNREIAKAGGKKRGKQNLGQTRADEDNRIAAIVLKMLKTEFQRVDAQVAQAVYKAEQTAAKQESFEQYHCFIQNLLNNFKEEVIQSVMTIHNTGKHTNEPHHPTRYSNKAQDGDGRTVHTSSRLPFVLHNEDPALDDATLSATSHTKETTKEAAPPGEMVHHSLSQPLLYQTEDPHLDHACLSPTSHTLVAEKTMVPSFSLGLTQELNPLGGVVICLTSPDHGDEEVSGGPSDPIVPAGLVKDYQCGAAILTRARDAQPPFSAYSDHAMVMSKFSKLVDKITNPFVINVSGLAVTSKDMTGIIELTRSMPARVIDILVRFVRTTCNKEQHSSGVRIAEFLDTRYVALLCKHSPKFDRSKSPDAYAFPKGLVEHLGKDDPSKTYPTHYYFPFNLGNNQWVAVCFDFATWKLTVLDCNIALHSDSDIAKQMRPFTDMFPSMLMCESSSSTRFMTGTE
ncbi:hypothetical protein Bca52824_012378 [Brassica carinata]|uniref:DUF1985 domain-containing protein n=1 Tax=Brassica carinata TaxID=52824 RepID=A0A8X8B1H3_BRACI|nr:hypothetical protein Bca52824_012378 [Brassica carinata]